ncbi:MULTISPECIES: RNA polymerase sigma factor [unclassified Nocardiopsis]|uniref:RNA polymerase sigma factor n=1 Tax=unclassified Nocardiopsis TaxID=2649073 RepID=UPI00135C7362|nr:MULTISPECIES: sigma-70 family RNA polymerase sigma factor [unclassified Nocardiopsis]
MLADTELPETVLVERAQDGDERAFEILVRRYQDTVFRFALRIVADPAEALDVAQEALVTVWRKLPELDEPRTFAAWLYRTVGRRALNAVRARRRVEPIGEREPFAREAGPVEQALAQGLREALLRALAELPPPQRVCWVLREMEGLGYEEIAELVGATPGAVRGRIHRARTHLVEELRPWR